MHSLISSKVPGLELLHRGKVRDVYRIDQDHLLLVATDRFSAFDVVFEQAIAGKGIILTQLSRFWFEELAPEIPHQVVGYEVADLPNPARGEADQLRGRFLIVRALEIVPFECIVRGRLIGSAWKEYAQTGRLFEAPLPPGLAKGAILDPPRFTPSTKAPAGQHDEPVAFDALRDHLGESRAGDLRLKSLRVFTLGSERARRGGLELLDTKLEWGLSGSEFRLADEVLTPDSSRFWRAEDVPGSGPFEPPPPYDKQVVRDWLEGQDWDRSVPGPRIPSALLEEARSRYVEIYERLTGEAVPYFDAS